MLRETNCRSGVTFKGCHFTGAKEGKGAFEEYQFESDGLVTFERNNFGLPTEGPAKMLVIGQNKNLGSNSDMILSITERSGKMVTKRRQFRDTLSFDAIKFSRRTHSENHHLTGTLRVTITGQSAIAGVSRIRVEEFGVSISATANNTIHIQSVSQRVIDQDASGFVIGIADVGSNNSETFLRINCVSDDASVSSYVFASFDYELSNSAPGGEIALDFV